jgi:hypothetical protein
LLHLCDVKGKQPQQKQKNSKYKIMKTLNNQTLNNLEKVSGNQTFQETRETVTNNHNTPTHKQSLSSADLWNIQRMARIRNTRRFLVS